MLIFLILGLLIGALSVVFALQNITLVSVHFLTWTSADISLAVVLLIAIVTGMVMSILVSVPEVIKDQMKIRLLQKKITEQEAEIEHYKKLATEASRTTLI